MGFTDVVLHSYRRAGLAVTALALPGLLMTATATASTSPAARTTAASTTALTTAATPHTAKPAPARPPASPGAATGAAIPVKPHPPHQNQPPGTWTVALTASPTLLWPDQYTTLTATASTDVGPTPYYLRIYDLTTGAYIATCASGTTCAAPVTQPAPTTHTYIAVIASPSAAYPPAGEQAISAQVAVDWHGTDLTLTASQATVPTGTTSTLTATTSQDIGPSPFWTEIFDTTTGTTIAACGYGTTCTATISQNTPTTHEYIAYLSANSTAYPPPSIQQTSAPSFITWSDLGWQATLSAPAYTTGSETVTATANGNVLPTPYYIEIFNETTSTWLAACGSGTTCTATFTPAPTGSSLIAFISRYATTFPPPAIVASSNVTTSYLQNNP